MTKKIGKKVIDTKKIAALRLLILDVDGVMTDGKIFYGPDGAEMKAFDVKDCTAIKYWLRCGLGLGFISGRASGTTAALAEELGISMVESGVKNKLPAFDKMIAAAGVAYEETIAVGDDLVDIPMVSRAGLGIAVRDASPELKDAADLVTNKKGGRGAVREVIRFILKTQGKWDPILARYYS